MVYLLAQIWPEIISLTKLIVTVPEQLSEAETKLILGVGTAELQLTVIVLGQEMLGGVISFTVIS